MTYNFKQTRDPMDKIQSVLIGKNNEGMTFKEMAAVCNTTPQTISNWINKGCDLKWYSVFDICLGFDLDLKSILEGTTWEKIV
jgi:hypothetical protein